jgi:hypothetical protein
MTEHELKTWPEHYAAIDGGSKTVELRLNDRPYAVGDSLLLREWEPLEAGYTGRQLRVRVTHILRGGEWLAPGYIAMSIRLMSEDGNVRVQEDFRKVADAQREEIAELKQEAAEWKGLAERRRDELSSVLSDVRLLHEAARAVVNKIERDDNNVTPDTAAALRELARCVSSNQAETEKGLPL